jgi:cephalosporin hydroxylase
MADEELSPRGTPQPPRQVQISARDVVDLFHQLYYDVGQRGGTWQQTFWMGLPVQKFPTDLVVYQELIHRVRPGLIVETGTRAGGSALFLCHMLDLIGGAGGEGRVVSIDVESPPQPVEHPRLTLLRGSSSDPAIVERVRQMAAGVTPIMVILDADHSRDHVLAELAAYHGLVTPGSYLIVEDTNVNGHPVYPQHGPGPTEAVREFLAQNHDFQIDQRCEKFLLTTNPGGYLRRRDAAPA